MTTKLTREKLDVCATEDISIPWLVRERAIEAGYYELAKVCLSGIAHTYTRILASSLYSRSNWFMNLEKFEESLLERTKDESVRSWIRARVYAGVGNECYWMNDLAKARKFYRAAVRTDPRMFSVRVKVLLLSLGKAGDYLRRRIAVRSSAG
jgi:hypothetical protein